MRPLNEIYQELYSHPEFVAMIEFWDKEQVLDELYNAITDVDGWDEQPQDYVESICEKWYDEHIDDIKKNFRKYFTMGEYHHYLDIEIEEWLEKFSVESK